MKAILRLEAIGDNFTQKMKLFRSKADSCEEGLGQALWGGPSLSPWVAEIVGLDDKWKFSRKFLKGKKDYSESNSAGSRGVYLHFMINSGHIYEVKELTSWSSYRRYFCSVTTEGDIQEIPEEEVIEWLKKDSE